MNMNPDDPTLEEIIDMGLEDKKISNRKNNEKNIYLKDKDASRKREVYKNLRLRGHDKKSARTLARLASSEKSGKKKILYEGIAGLTIGGVNEDTIDTTADIIGMNKDNIKTWNIYTEWINNYFSAIQVDWLMEGISAGSEALFGAGIPEDFKANSNQIYFWSRYAFTALRQYSWSVKDKYIPSYLSWITPSTTIFAVPSLTYEGWLILRRNVLNAKESAIQSYNNMMTHWNGKSLPEDQNINGL